MFCGSLRNFSLMFLSAGRFVSFRRKKSWKNVNRSWSQSESSILFSEQLGNFWQRTFNCYSVMAQINSLPAASQHTVVNVSVNCGNPWILPILSFSFSFLAYVLHSVCLIANIVHVHQFRCLHISNQQVLLCTWMRKIPCGGGLEYLYRSPVSFKRRQKGNPVPGGITGLPCSQWI
jgi:hypothetical protein